MGEGKQAQWSFYWLKTALQSVIGWCYVMKQNPPISSQPWLFPSHSFMQFNQDFNIVVLTDSLATWNTLCHHNTLDIQENNQHGLELWMTHVAFFCSLRVWWLPEHWLSFCFWVIRKYPSLITSNFWLQQTWSILCALQKVRTDFLSEVLFVQPTAFLEPFFHRPFPCSVHLLKCIKHFLPKITISAVAQTPILWCFQITSHTL